MRILVALDESDGSTRVVEFVNRFFGALDVEVLAVSVADQPSRWIPPATGFGGVYGWSWPTAVPIDDVATDREASIQRARDVLDRSGIDDDEAIADAGDPTVVILGAARDHQADLVVVGSNQRSILERLVTRSVTDEVLREADRPVLVVPAR